MRDAVIETDEAGAKDPLFDPFLTPNQPDPYPAYRVLRDLHPIYHVKKRNIWVVSRYEDIQTASRDWKSLANTPSVDLDDTRDIFGPGAFIDMDPPRHAALRSIFRHRFSPSAINATWPALVTAEVDRLFGQLAGRDTVDFVGDLAWPLPVAMIRDFMGFPVDDGEMLTDLLRAIVTREPGTPEAPESSYQAARELGEYFTVQIAERERRPTDDLLSLIVDGRATGTIEEDEVLGLCFLMCDAATSTTANLIANALALLALHPAERALATARPEQLGSAVEEILRFDAPVQYLGRRATCDVEIHGVTLPANSRVALLYGAANRDERRFANPDVLDLSRVPKRNLAFGEGIHFCLGAPLARLETRLVLKRVLEQFPDYELCGVPQRNPQHTTRGYARLPVALRP